MSEPYVMVAQEFLPCDLCGRPFDGPDAQSITLVHGEHSKVARKVCPACMKHIGFAPTVSVPVASYERLVSHSALRAATADAETGET